MINKIIFISFFLIVKVVQGQQAIEEMIEQEEKNCPANILKDVKKYTNKYDTLSVKQIKKNLSNELKSFKKNKDSLLKEYQWSYDYDKKYLKSSIKNYKPKEENISDFNINEFLSVILNQNHLTYQKYLEKGLFFEQNVINDSISWIEPIVSKNDTIILKRGDKFETITPFPFLNIYYRQEIRIKKIYFNDSTEEKVDLLHKIGGDFPNIHLRIPETKYIDSLKIDFKITYFTEIDKISFTNKEIGIQKGHYKLIEIKDNYIEYEKPNDLPQDILGQINYFYPYILKEVSYNKKGEVLQEEYGGSDFKPLIPQKKYEKKLIELEEQLKLVKDLENRKDIYKTLYYLELKKSNNFLKTSRLTKRILLNGNVQSFDIFLEKELHNLTFSSVLKNIHLKKTK